MSRTEHNRRGSRKGNRGRRYESERSTGPRGSTVKRLTHVRDRRAARREVLEQLPDVFTMDDLDPLAAQVEREVAEHEGADGA